jgi:hypothetical protein
MRPGTSNPGSQIGDPVRKEPKDFTQGPSVPPDTKKAESSGIQKAWADPGDEDDCTSRLREAFGKINEGFQGNHYYCNIFDTRGNIVYTDDDGDWCNQWVRGGAARTEMHCGADWSKFTRAVAENACDRSSFERGARIECQYGLYNGKRFNVVKDDEKGVKTYLLTDRPDDNEPFAKSSIWLKDTETDKVITVYPGHLTRAKTKALILKINNSEVIELRNPFKNTDIDATYLWWEDMIGGRLDSIKEALKGQGFDTSGINSVSIVGVKALTLR